MKHNLGWVYIIKTEPFCDLIKIGYTSRRPYDRANEFSKATNTPYPYYVAYQVLLWNAESIEKQLHKYFIKQRFNKSKEWFSCSIEEVETVILELFKDNVLFSEKTKDINYDLGRYYTWFFLEKTDAINFIIKESQNFNDFKYKNVKYYALINKDYSDKYQTKKLSQQGFPEDIPLVLKENILFIRNEGDVLYENSLDFEIIYNTVKEEDEIIESEIKIEDEIIESEIKIEDEIPESRTLSKIREVPLSRIVKKIHKVFLDQASCEYKDNHEIQIIKKNKVTLQRKLEVLITNNQCNYEINLILEKELLYEANNHITRKMIFFITSAIVFYLSVISNNELVQSIPLIFIFLWLCYSLCLGIDFIKSFIRKKSIKEKLNLKTIKLSEFKKKSLCIMCGTTYIIRISHSDPRYIDGIWLDYSKSYKTRASDLINTELDLMSYDQIVTEYKKDLEVLIKAHKYMCNTCQNKYMPNQFLVNRLNIKVPKNYLNSYIRKNKNLINTKISSLYNGKKY